MSYAWEGSESSLHKCLTVCCLNFFVTSRATHVPVGEDQLQHLELARDLAKSFNSTYKRPEPMFPEPQPLLGWSFIVKRVPVCSVVGVVDHCLTKRLPCLSLSGKVQRVMSLRNPLKKMSKSDNQPLSTLSLSDSPDEIQKKIRRAVTDSTSHVTFEPEIRPGVSNLVSIYSAISGRSQSEVCAMFEGKQSIEFKDSLVEVLVDTLRPIREEMEHLTNNPDHVVAVLRDGAERAREIAEMNWNTIRELVGLL